VATQLTVTGVVLSSIESVLLVKHIHGSRYLAIYVMKYEVFQLPEFRLPNVAEEG
jgi:hypothetical protein